LNIAIDIAIQRDDKFAVVGNVPALRDTIPTGMSNGNSAKDAYMMILRSLPKKAMPIKGNAMTTM
jgi:hypothetical protein